MEYIRHIAVHWPVRRPRLLGLRLRRFSLGHLRLLDAISSPFISGGTTTITDATHALLILSLPWRAARRLLATPRPFRWAARLIAARLSIRHTPEAIISALADYIHTSLWTPEPYIPAGTPPPPPPATALSLRLAARLSALNYNALLLRPVRHIFDAPVDETLLWATVAAEAAGTEFVTPTEAAQLRETP